MITASDLHRDPDRLPGPSHTPSNDRPDCIRGQFVFPFIRVEIRLTSARLFPQSRMQIVQPLARTGLSRAGCLRQSQSIERDPPLSNLKFGRHFRSCRTVRRRVPRALSTSCRRCCPSPMNASLYTHWTNDDDDAQSHPHTHTHTLSFRMLWPVRLIYTFQILLNSETSRRNADRKDSLVDWKRRQNDRRPINAEMLKLLSIVLPDSFFRCSRRPYAQSCSIQIAVHQTSSFQQPSSSSSSFNKELFRLTFQVQSHENKRRVFSLIERPVFQTKNPIRKQNKKRQSA